MNDIQAEKPSHANLAQNPMILDFAPDATELVPGGVKPHLLVSSALARVIRIDANIIPETRVEDENSFSRYLNELRRHGIRTLDPTFRIGATSQGVPMRYTEVDYIRTTIDFDEIIRTDDQKSLQKYDRLLTNIVTFGGSKVVHGGAECQDLLGLRQYVLDAEEDPNVSEPILADLDIIAKKDILPADERELEDLQNYVFKQAVGFIKDAIDLREAMRTEPESVIAIEEYINGLANGYPAALSGDFRDTLIEMLHTGDRALIEAMETDKLENG